MKRLFEEGRKAYLSGDYATALDKWQEALSLAKESRDRKVEGVILNNIANIHRIYFTTPSSFSHNLALIMR